MADNPPARMLTKLGVLTSRPTAFAIFLAYAAAWIIFARETLDWHAVATLATWAMTLFIQRAEHRDTQAIHAKLDELLAADRNADTDVGRIDQMEPERIEEMRAQDR